MLSSFKRWYIDNQVEITWFLIGMLIAQGAEHSGQGHYAAAAVLWTLAVINFLTRKIKLT